MESKKGQENLWFFDNVKQAGGPFVHYTRIMR